MDNINDLVILLHLQRIGQAGDGQSLMPVYPLDFHSPREPFNDRAIEGVERMIGRLQNVPERRIAESPDRGGHGQSEHDRDARIQHG